MDISTRAQLFSKIRHSYIFWLNDPSQIPPSSRCSTVLFTFSQSHVEIQKAFSESHSYPPLRSCHLFVSIFCCLPKPTTFVYRISILTPQSLTYWSQDVYFPNLRVLHGTYRLKIRNLCPGLLMVMGQVYFFPTSHDVELGILLVPVFPSRETRYSFFPAFP